MGKKAWNPGAVFLGFGTTWEQCEDGSVVMKREARQDAEMSTVLQGLLGIPTVALTASGNTGQSTSRSCKAAVAALARHAHRERLARNLRGVVFWRQLQA